MVDRAETGTIELHASTEVLQEFLFHRLRRMGRPEAVAQTRAVRRLCVRQPFDGDVVDRMIELVETSGLRGRDAVHAATALLGGFDSILSADADFDDAPGLTRADPTDGFNDH